MMRRGVYFPPINVAHRPLYQDCIHVNGLPEPIELRPKINATNPKIGSTRHGYGPVLGHRCTVRVEDTLYSVPCQPRVGTTQLNLVRVPASPHLECRDSSPEPLEASH